MSGVTFDDLMLIRKGGEGLTMGSCVSSVEKLTTLEEWETKAEALKLLFEQTLGQKPDVACSLDLTVLGEVDRGEYIERKVEYAVGPGERISAYALLPKGVQGKSPAVLCIHPTTAFGKEQVIGNDPSPKGQDRAYAVHLVRRGYVTFAYDLLSANERNYPGCKSFETAPFYEKFPTWSIRGKDLHDAQCALDVMSSMDEVDADRIGSIGHSQGGGITIHLAAVDSRVKVGRFELRIVPGSIVEESV